MVQYAPATKHCVSGTRLWVASALKNAWRDGLLPHQYPQSVLFCIYLRFALGSAADCSVTLMSIRTALDKAK